MTIPAEQPAHPRTPPRATPRTITPAMILVSAVWAASVVMSYVAHQRGLDAPGLCMFRRITTLPCPGCGGTRAAFSLARLDLAGALAFNPLITLLLLGAPPLLLFAWLRRGRPALSPGARKAWTIAIAAACLINWAWVLYHEGVF